MNRLMKAKLDIRKQKQEYLKRQLLLLSPQSRIHTKRQYAADLEERLRQQMKQQIIEARHQMEIFAGTLDGLSPAKKLMQGYSVAVNDAGRNIRIQITVCCVVTTKNEASIPAVIIRYILVDFIR